MDENKTAAVQQEKASPKLMVGYGLGDVSLGKVQDKPVILVSQSKHLQNLRVRVFL